MHKQRLLVALAIALFATMSGCAEPEPENIEVTREVGVPQTVEVTREVTKIVEEVVKETVEVTRIELVVVTATSTPTPINSPTPTSIPTVKPTASSTPEPPATPGLGAADRQYIVDSGHIVGEYLTWIDAYIQHSRLAVDDTSLYRDETWKDKLIKILANMMVLNEDVRQLDCPTRCQTAHTHLLDTANHLESVIAVYAGDLDRLTFSHANRALPELGKAMDAIKEFEDQRLQLADLLP